jgi:hypothetical protein
MRGFRWPLSRHPYNDGQPSLCQEESWIFRCLIAALRKIGLPDPNEIPMARRFALAEKHRADGKRHER